MRLLHVEDEADFRTLVRTALEGHGHTCAEAADVPAAHEALYGADFDLVLLDLEMPGPSGFDLIEQMREAGDDIPIIVVSGRDAGEDKVRALKLGADDYVVKPADLDELEARAEAVVRRRESLPPLVFGDVELDLARRRVNRNGQPCWLSPREFDLLLALARAGGEPVTRKALLEDVWDIRFDPGTNVLDVHIGRVRKKVDRHGRPLIETVRGTGYRLVRHTADDAEES